MSNEHNTYALSGLKRKLEELTKIHRQLHAEIKQNDLDRKLIVGAIRMFDPAAAKAIAARVGLDATADRADGLAVRLRPADLLEHLPGFIVRHAEDGREFQRLGGGGLEEVLRHLST